MQDGSRGEVINLWRLWHGRLPELDLDQARLGFTSTTDLLDLGQPRLWSRLWVCIREKKLLWMLKGLRTSLCQSGFFLTPIKLTPLIPYGDVGISLPVQMSAHILWPLWPEIRLCYRGRAGKELHKTARGRARQGQAKTKTQMFWALQTSGWLTDHSICLSGL